jgi:lysophospholipase L1-like esterase
MQKLVDLDGLIPKENWGGYFNVYRNRSWPSTYLTNCEGAHPTIAGYKVIASELAQFINSHGYV